MIGLAKSKTGKKSVIPEPVKTLMQMVWDAEGKKKISVCNFARKENKENVHLLCVMREEEDGSFTPVPIAEVILKDPNDIYIGPGLRNK